MSHTVITILWTVMLASVAFGAKGEPKVAASWAKTYRIEEQRLGPVHDKIMSSTFSKDGCHWAYVTSKGEKQLVVVNGQPGTGYDSIAMGGPGYGGPIPVFSPNGKRIAYKARKGTKWFVVVDGRLGLGYDAIRVGPIWSPDSKHFAYRARTDKKSVVVVDGRPSRKWDPAELEVGDPLFFSPDGKPYRISGGKTQEVPYCSR